MRYSLDDRIYAVDNVWLGPPGKTTPWRARYVAYFLGAVVFILVQIVERRMGIAIGFFPIAWGLIATVVITRLVLRFVNYDRPLLALLTAVSNEVSAPRRDTRPTTVTLRPGLLPTLSDDEWFQEPVRSHPIRKALATLRTGLPTRPGDSPPAATTPTTQTEQHDVVAATSPEPGSRPEPAPKVSLIKTAAPEPAPRPALSRLRGATSTRPRRRAPRPPEGPSGLANLPHYGRDRSRYAPSYASAPSPAPQQTTTTDPHTSSLSTVSTGETEETP